MGLDIDLYTPKIDINNNEADDIIIEITGLKSISKFIGLEDTPLYYDNGKFFKVENNKIIYTDIEWKDISGDLEDAPELVSLIEKLIEEYNKEIINRYINIHNNSRTAHPYIQDIISQNYITLDTKIDDTKEELSEDISDLDNKLNIEINNREVADNSLSENIQQETLARIEADTTLQNNINILTNNLSTETENRISADNLLRDDIDDISGELAQEIVNRQTQDNLLQEQITSNYNTLNNKVDAESSNRISADTTLQNNIDTLTNTVEDNNTTINNRVDEIVDSFDGDISDLTDKVTVNSNDIATIQNIINTYGDIVTYNATDFATKSQGLLADSALQPNDNITLLNNNAGFITNAVNDLTNYYLKSETYTKLEVQQLIASIPKFTVLVVQELPLTGQPMTLYLLPKDGEAPDVYEEYIWITETETYELIGSTAVDLDGYATEDWVEAKGYATENFVNDGLTTKQNTLTAGDNIAINGNTISAIDTTYTAGTGISIENGVISNTQTSAEWGNIEGNIADQTDLQNALDAKQDVLTSENAGNCIEIATGSSSGLPAEYQEVEYLDSSGTQYIDTGITPTATKLRIVTKCQRLANTKGGDYLGSATTTSPRAGFRLYNDGNNGNLVIQATININIQIPVTDVLDCDITVIQNTSCNYKVNNVSDTVQNNTINLTFDKSIILYGFHFGDNIFANSIPQRFWGFTVYKEDVLIQNLVPARRKSDSVLGMYDTVSGNFLTNAGTGTFIAGQDVEDTTKINFVNNSGYVTSGDIGNGTITINQGGTPKGTFTTNQNGNTTIDLDAGSTIDQTFDGTSTNAQSGVAISGELGNFVQKEDVSVWTPRVEDTNLGNYNMWRALAYDNTKFVALGNDGYISTSTDGITWTSIIQNTELGENSWYDLVYNGISFIALGLHGYTSTSTDGITWTTAVQNTNLGDNTWESLVYDGTKFVALGRKGYISTSTDGITWTEAVKSVELGEHIWEYLVYDGTKFVALEQNGYISTSTDGITWTTAVKNTNLGSHIWKALAYDGIKFVALSSTGYISTSTDGITWTTAIRDTNLGSAQWMALTYSGTKFVALAQSGFVSTSSGFTHLLNIQNNLYIDFTNNNKFNLLDGTTGLIPDERLSNNIARTSSIGNGTITFTQGGVTKGTITTNQSGDTTIDFDTGGGGGAVDSVNGQTGTVVLTASDVGALADTTTIPSKTSDLTNDSGFITGITSSDVTTALGYTPYNSTNPDGYITSSALNGYATETWVGNQGYLTGITSSDVITALTYTPYNGATNPNGYITSADLPTNYLTTDTAQDISGRKTFLGEKAIYFKQLTTANKLGFTLYNPSNTELGALEYRPSTIGSASLLALNCPQTMGGYVGFRYWGTPAVNIVAPKVATAGNYYIPINFTDGTNTVNADNKGSVNISSLLPSIDSSLDKNSTNPVQNKAIAEAIEDISLAKNPNLNLIGGSLNIDSGNVSGFSTIDYMQFPFVFNFNGYTWTLEMGFTTGLDITTQQNILDSYYGVAFAINNGKFLMALSSNGNSWNIGSASGTYSVQANTAYSVKIAWDGSNYTLSYALDETNYTTDISIASTVVHHSTQEYVGGEPELFGSGSQHPFTGVINLNNWSLIVNGLEVWLGMDDVGLGSRANIDLSNLTEAGLAKFQAPLISGENIKTINNESILGSGNINIQSGGTVDQTYNATSANAQSGVAIAGELVNYMPLNSSSDIDIYANSINFDLGDKLTLNSAPVLCQGWNSLSDNVDGFGINIDTDGLWYSWNYNHNFYVDYESSSMYGYEYGSNNTVSHKHGIEVYGNGINFSNLNYESTITIPSDGLLALNGHNIITDNNLKTINNQSIIGSGNIDIQSGVSMTYDSTTETLIFS